jgi:hypothetical protein
LGAYGKIFIVILKEYMDSVEGEVVARQANCDREWTQICANFRVRNREWTRKDSNADQSRLAAFPKNRISEHSRLLASIGGSAHLLDISEGASRFLIISLVGTSRCGVQVGAARRPYQKMRCALFQKQLMQVVDFQDSFRYFWIFLMVLVASVRGFAPVLESSETAYASR